MNVENILKVADAIEQHSIADLGFNMGWYMSQYYPDLSGHSCKTTACIAGWATATLAVDVWGSEIPSLAQCLLDLDEEDSCALFCGCPKNTPFGKVTPEQAVKTLRYLAATGKVDWDAAQEQI